MAALDRSLFIEPLIEFTRDLCFLVSMFDNDTRFDGDALANLASVTCITRCGEEEKGEIEKNL